MGRARGGPAAAATDNFNQVLGVRRGPMEVDTLLSYRPSPSARQELQRLVTSPGFNETEDELLFLHRHRALLNGRPLLDELATEVCRHQVKHVLKVWSPQTRELLGHAGLRNEFSDQLFVSPERIVHVCAEGRNYQVANDLQTACGIPLSHSSFVEVRRGGWLRSQSRDLSRCPSCAESADSLPDSREKTIYPVLGPEMEEELLTRLAAIARADLKRALASERCPEVKDFTETVTRDFPRLLIDFAAEQMHGGGPAVIAKAVGLQRWRTLRNAVGVIDLDPARIWPLEKWREHLLPFTPRNSRDRDYRIREPDSFSVADIRTLMNTRARASLFTALADELGLENKDPTDSDQSAKRRSTKRRSAKTLS